MTKHLNHFFMLADVPGRDALVLATYATEERAEAIGKQLASAGGTAWVHTREHITVLRDMINDALAATEPDTATPEEP